MNCLGYKQSVEEGRLNNKDKVFIKIKGLYTGTMDEEASFDGEEAEVIESQDDEVEVINVGTYYISICGSATIILQSLIMNVC